ncbi:MAG: 3D domain-containing protein [Pseudomonadales bacterium]
MRKFSYFIILATIPLLFGCSDKVNSLEVTATAYTSSPQETDSTPSLAAWGDTLKPGMKSIAVSRDLIKMGLTHGVEVSIDGMAGKYKVLDKMNKRWKRKIDIYMGKDIKKAKEWGKRKVTIHWVSEPL